MEDQPWDTRVLGLRCARIADFKTIMETSSRLPLPYDFYQPLVRAIAKNGWEYVITRLPAGQWRRYHLLENAGFRFIDQILGFRRPEGVPLPNVSQDVHLRLAQLADEGVVAELSAKSFVRSRFHNDPLLSPDQCRRIYSEWGANSVRGQAAQWVWVAETDRRIVGFITLKTKEERGIKAGAIDLIGVLPEFSGRGVGQTLVARGCEWLSSQGIPTVQVQTQSDNFAAIQLYTRMGFKPEFAGVTLRWSSRHG